MSAAHRISAIVYGSLSLLAVAAAATAKGYVDSIGEFSFLVLVSAAGLALAHFWSELLAHRLAGQEQIDWQQAAGSVVMVLPGLLMVLVALLTGLIGDSLEVAVTVAMAALTLVLLVITWYGMRGRSSALGWALGTGAVGAARIVFKVVA